MASRHTGEKEGIISILMLFLFYTMNRVIKNIKAKSDSLNLNDGIFVLVQTAPHQLYK